METNNALLTSNALSEKQEFGTDWEPYVIEPDDGTSDLLNILTPKILEEEKKSDPRNIRLPNWKTKITEIIDDNTWWNQASQKVTEFFKQQEVQIPSIVIAAIAALYFCCAPVSWPRCNCCVWVCKSSTDMVLYCWRAAQIMRKRTQLKRLRTRRTRRTQVTPVEKR